MSRPPWLQSLLRSLAYLDARVRGTARRSRRVRDPGAPARVGRARLGPWPSTPRGPLRAPQPPSPWPSGPDVPQGPLLLSCPPERRHGRACANPLSRYFFWHASKAFLKRFTTTSTVRFYQSFIGFFFLAPPTSPRVYEPSVFVVKHCRCAYTATRFIPDIVIRLSVRIAYNWLTALNHRNAILICSPRWKQLRQYVRIQTAHSVRWSSTIRTIYVSIIPSIR